MRRRIEHYRNIGVPNFRHRKPESFASFMAIMSIVSATAALTPYLANKIAEVVNLPKVETKEYLVPMEGHVSDRISPYRNPVITYKTFMGIKID